MKSCTKTTHSVNLISVQTISLFYLDFGTEITANIMIVHMLARFIILDLVSVCSRMSL